MSLFLQIVGGVFVALILVALAVILFLRWKLSAWARQMSDQMQDLGSALEKFGTGAGPMAAALGGMMEPLTLNLHRTGDEPDEDFALQIQAWTKGLTNAGFVKVGDFEAEPTMLWLRALTHPESGAAAALYVMPLAGAWYDVTARLPDGSTFTMTDTQRELTDLPPWSTLTRLEAGTPPAKAYEKLLRKIDGREVARYTPQNFVEAFEEQYRRGTLWHVKRGDTPEELKRITGEDADEEPDSAFVEQLMDTRRRMRSMQIDELLKDQWLKGADLSAYDYDRIEDRLVVIHELTPPEVLTDLWSESCAEVFEDELDGVPDVERIITSQEPRQAFRTLQQKLPPDGRFEHYAALDGDIAGDLWMRPEES